MGKINSRKIKKELTDIIIHRECVIRTGSYLATYLKKINHGGDSISIQRRCAVHDISKLQNLEEFMALASIVDSMDGMRSPTHIQTKEEIKAKEEHWKNNSHHPEHYDDPNDMSDLDIMEMACDCFARNKQIYSATDLYNLFYYKGMSETEIEENIETFQAARLIEYIKYQQKVRFHFDHDHLTKLLKYTKALIYEARHDDYSDIINKKYDFGFNFTDSVVQKLEDFDTSCYPNYLETKRLYMRQNTDAVDFATVAYKIYLKDDNTKIGNITLKFDGTLDYKIFSNYLGNDYAVEALNKFIDTSNFEEIKIKIRDNDESRLSVLDKINFETESYYDNYKILKHKKHKYPVQKYVKKRNYF